MALPPRIPNFSYVGFYRYFLTFCTLDRRQTLRNADVVTATLLKFREVALPDHVHLLWRRQQTIRICANSQRWRNNDRGPLTRWSPANDCGRRVITIAFSGRMKTCDRSRVTSSRIQCVPALCRHRQPIRFSDRRGGRSRSWLTVCRYVGPVLLDRPIQKDGPYVVSSSTSSQRKGQRNVSRVEEVVR
jgi:hypothetical protein